MYLAHTKDGQKSQSLKDHLNNTAILAERFTSEFDAGDYGYFAGISHDIGKYSREFQNYLLNSGSRTEHSAASASEIMKILKNQVCAYIISYCTSGHHSGLPDGGNQTDTEMTATLSGKLKRQKIHGADYSAYSSEIDLKKCIVPKPLSIPAEPVEFRDGFTMSAYIRMIYSALTDADFLDTEEFMSDGTVIRSSGDDMITLLGKFNGYMKKFGNPKNDIHRKRNKIFDQCTNAAESEERGLFSLTVPTGGGKTLSGMNFALRHAVKHKMKRIIYVIPYTSIIDQTADIFAGIFGNENVLAHYSTVSYDHFDEGVRDDVEYRKRLSSENWDAPVIITTNVQFFESFFANKSSKCRKLHNTANSVIIFDESQMLPTDYLIPCIRIIASLVLNFRSSCILCTATQPSFDEYFKGMKIREICENRDELYNFFRRVRIKNVNKKSFDELADEVNSNNQVLCIVNTKIQALELFDKIREINPDETGIYHLSTSMCPSHRKEIIKSIRDRLQSKENPVCRVIATSLVECGVDFDFPVVYRETAGIDSVIQAAGRCNREGKRSVDESIVYVFEPDDIYKNKIHLNLKRPIEVSKMVWKNDVDPSEPEIIQRYFNTLHSITGDALDKKDIIKKFNEKTLIYPFASVADEFKLIETSEKSILIPLNEDADQLAELLRSRKISRDVMRKLGAYTVNVYSYQYDKLYGSGALEITDVKNNSISILRDMRQYDEKTGLNIPDTGIGIFI